MDYGLDVEQFRSLIVRPTQQRLMLWAPPMESQVLGTGLCESHLIYVRQLPRGPALGVFQMEPATHADIWINYLRYKPDLKRLVQKTASYFSGDFPDPAELVSNLSYAAAMCTVHYERSKLNKVNPLPFPPSDRADLLAAYWKRYYNTPKGKGTVEQALPHFTRAVDCRS